MVHARRRWFSLGASNVYNLPLRGLLWECSNEQQPRGEIARQACGERTTMIRQNDPPVRQKGIPTRIETAGALAVLTFVTLLSGQREKNVYLRLHAVVSATLAFVTSILVAVFGWRSWLRGPVAAAFIASLVANRRLLQKMAKTETSEPWWKRTWLVRMATRFVTQPLKLFSRFRK